MSDFTDFVAECKNQLPFYAEHCLKILDKRGELIPFRLNRAQLYIHERLEEQLRATGRVRAHILKGRQQGSSTYIGARFRQRLKHTTGLKAYIITHEQKATDNLFVMHKRFHDNEPARVRPHLGSSNEKELVYDRLDSRLEVATAGSKDTGRSGTGQLLHGSECAFWPNAKSHFAGLGQAIADVDGSEIILESTSDGPQGEFYKRWRTAERGESDFINIFVPWFWQPEYRQQAPEGFQITAEEQALQSSFGLDNDQLYWRRNKIASSFSGDADQFKMEYPNSPEEAWLKSDSNTVCRALDVMKARKAQGMRAVGPIIMGVDVARFGDDRTVIVVRQGRVLQRIKILRKRSITQVAGVVASMIDAIYPDRVFIDCDGLGVGVHDILVDGNYKTHQDSDQRLVMPAKGSDAAHDPDRFYNARAEMYWNVREWLESGAQIPDDDEVASDLLLSPYEFRGGRIIVTAKDKIKENEGRSPDIADAIAYTFAQPVRVAQKGPMSNPMPPFEPLDPIAGF